MTNIIATQLMPLLAKIQLFITSAEGLENVKEYSSGIWDSLQAKLWEFAGIDWLIEHSIGDDNLQSMQQILFLGSKSGGIYTDYWSAINAALSVIKPIGYALITTFFIIYIFDLASRDQITFDMIVKLGIQLIVVVAIAGNLHTIINSFLSISDSLLNTISSRGGFGGSGAFSLGDTSGYANNIIEQWSQKSGDFLLSALFKAFGLYAIHQIAVIGIFFAAFSRALDVGWRIAFAPIGIANSFEGGSNSAGVKYLKNLFASILAGVMVYVIIALGFKICGGLLASGIKAKVLASQACLLASAGAAIGVSAKSKELIS